MEKLIVLALAKLRYKELTLKENEKRKDEEIINKEDGHRRESPQKSIRNIIYRRINHFR